MIKPARRNRFSLSLMAAALCLSSLGADAAGLGKITVLTPLGQPLRAELELTASRDELSSMAARLASAEAFKQVGIEYVPGIADLRFAVDKRPDGQPIVRVTTERPMNEPFLDILLELTWASGRLVREYTILLDPPDVFSKPPVAPVALPESKPVQKEPAPPPPPAVTPDAKVSAEPAKPVPMKEPAPAQEKAPASTRVVKSGDTLTKIAKETRPEGISLDQMLVALLRGNQDAFARNNMNRLKAGKILTIPTADTASAIAPGEARQTVVAQARDFNAYRQRLASAVAATPVKEDAAKQEVAGKITPKVEDKAPPPAPSKDKLEVSRTEAAKDTKGVQGRISALEEDIVARDRSLKEASSRIADLEKNLTDLKTLAELKSQAGAQMQQQAQKPAPEALAAAKPVDAVPAKPVEEAKPVDKPMEKVAEKPAESTTAAAAPAAAKPEDAAKPKEAAKPAAAKPAVAAKPPPEPPSFVEENPGLVYGGGGVVALLLGWLGYSSWRRKREDTLQAPPTSRLSEGDLMANSVFGSTGGQSVDTGASIQTDFSQANIAAIDADEGVDPVAEADVYMAYGRDAQAEEILLDALKTDPGRSAVYLKLLEIYSGRKDAKQFESMARSLHAQTGGAGADWERAAEMGRALDAGNPLYGGGADAGVASVEAKQEEILVPPSEAEKLRSTVTLPGQLAQMAVAASTTPVDVPPTLDFELDLDAASGAGKAAEVPLVAAVPSTVDFDLELGSLATPSAGPTVQPRDEQKPAGAEPVAKEVAALDFELDIDASPRAPEASAATAVVPAKGLDLSSIDLELGTPPVAKAAGPAAGGDEADNPDVATKLELAQAYEEMGDKEGARELLQEVLQEGSARQQGLARDRLASLNA